MNYTCRRGQHHTIAVRVKMLIWGMVCFFIKKSGMFLYCVGQRARWCVTAHVRRETGLELVRDFPPVLALDLVLAGLGSGSWIL